MPIALAMLIGLLSTPGIDNHCVKLTTDFFINENTFGVIYDVNLALLAADKDYAKATSDWSGVAKRLAANKAENEEFKKQGDRIVGLMTGKGCALPDHVTSPDTFREDRKACTVAKGTPQEGEVCGYITRAVARVMQSAEGISTHDR